MMLRTFIMILCIGGIYGWIVPRTFYLSPTNVGRRSLPLCAHLPKRSQQAPKGPVILVNEFITADPIRLIAPKVRTVSKDMKNVVGDESIIDDDTDEDDGEEEENLGDESEGKNRKKEAEAGDGSMEEMLGIYSLDDALQKAEEMGLDLVMINEKADPPVCKIIDFGKFKYKLSKKKKDNQKKQVKGGIKEVKMSYKIGIHDFDVRVRAAQKFISVGDRVRYLASIVY